jgi:hypothetical protein
MTASGTAFRPLTLTCSPLGVAAMLKLGDKPSLLELTHGAQASAHHLRGIGEGSVK